MQTIRLTLHVFRCSTQWKRLDDRKKEELRITKREVPQRLVYNVPPRVGLVSTGERRPSRTDFTAFLPRVNYLHIISTLW